MVHRLNQLAVALKREVGLAFRNKSRRRHFLIGLAMEELDHDVLKLVSGKRSFNIKENTLCGLDSIIGERWDITTSENLTTFVTDVKIVINKCNILTGTVWTAVHRSPVGEDYRIQLASDVLASDVLDHETIDEM